MAEQQHFYWRKENDLVHNLEYIVLGFQDAASPVGSLEAWICPGVGANLCRLSAGGKAIIDFDPGLLRPDFTGTPVLYPTPNRVRNGVFRYQGKTYRQVVRGVTIFEHGLVHGEPWKSSEPEIQPDAVTLKTWFEIGPQSDQYAAFPFEHTLALEFRLSAAGLQVTYRIENRSSEDLPFGFGLHPYFTRLGGDDGSCVELPARVVMDYTQDLLPTGRLIPVEGTIYDLRKPTSIGSIDFDHVFTDVPAGAYARVLYPGLGLSVQLVSTADFSHLVLYCPRGVEFFCLESQTCSTDAHNLYDRGFVSESGLKFVPAGKVHTGSVTYLVSKER
jgi:aldose 1-epimerase